MPDFTVADILVPVEQFGPAPPPPFAGAPVPAAKPKPKRQASLLETFTATKKKG